MAFFGFKSSKEVEEEKRKAAEAAARNVELRNQNNLDNLSSGSQVDFAIPYFDVFDPSLQHTGVPVAVHGSIVYAIEDMNQFKNMNKTEAFNDDAFREKLKGTVTKFVKGVVSNVPNDAQIPVVQLERKIMQISNLVESYVVPKVEKTFGIVVRSLDITEINVDQDSLGYRELKTMTADLEKERKMAMHNAEMSNFNMQQSMNQDMMKNQHRMNMEKQNTMHENELANFNTQHSLNRDAMQRQHEMNFGGQQELQKIQLEQQRMQMEHQKETMRIQREEMQRASKLQTEQTFMDAHKANLHADAINTAMHTKSNIFNQPQHSADMNNGMNMGAQMGNMNMNAQTGGINTGMGGMNLGAMNSMGSSLDLQFMIAVNGQQAGPYNMQQLQQLVQQGQLNAQTLVWRQGMAQWVQAGQVAELLQILSMGMPPMPGMPPIPGM